MKLLAIEMSRLTALFHVSRSAGQLYLPRAVVGLTSRYHFSSSPSSFDDLTGDRIDFKHGEFEGSAIESLEIYNDGIIISSRSDTDLIDGFLDDLCKWMSEDLGLSKIKNHSVDRLYDSSLIFETDKDILKPLALVSKVGDMVEKELEETSGLKVDYQPFGWSIAADQTQNPFLKPIAFRIERRIGTPFSMAKFITSAPLRTKQHLAILEKLEALV